MTKNYLFYIIFMMLIITVVAFILNLVILVPPSKDSTFISQDQVVSVALYHENEPYILNFSQQKELVKLINDGSQKDKIDKRSIDSSKIPKEIEKISIQRFKKTPLVLKPLGTADNKMVFAVEDEQAKEELYIIEKEKGSFSHLLKESYDD